MWGLWRNACIRAGLYCVVLAPVAVPRFVPADRKSGRVRHHRFGDLDQPPATPAAHRIRTGRAPAPRTLNPENSSTVLRRVNLCPCFVADIRRCTGGARPVHVGHPPCFGPFAGRKHGVRWQHSPGSKVNVSPEPSPQSALRAARRAGVSFPCPAQTQPWSGCL